MQLNPSVPRIYPHRGGGAEVAENSYQALELTQALGLKQVEIDVRLTADKVPVLQHDAVLIRPWGKLVQVEEIPWAQYRQLRGKQGEHPVGLRQALMDFPQLNFNLEPKTDAATRQVMQLVEELGAWDRIVFASFSPRRLRYMRRFPQAKTALGPDEVIRLVLASWVAHFNHGKLPDKWAKLIPRNSKGRVALQTPIRYGPISLIKSTFIDLAHRQGFLVEPWTINSALEMIQLAEAGVDGIMTDRPTLALQVLKTRL